MNIELNIETVILYRMLWGGAKVTIYRATYRVTLNSGDGKYQ